MKKYSFFIISCITICFSSCVKDLTNTVYNGSDMIEFSTLSRTITVPSTAGATVRDSILVQLVAPQRSTPLNVTYSLDVASTLTVSNYTLLNASPISIAPQTSSTWLRFVFRKPTTSSTLIVNLTGGDNVSPSFNFSKFTYTIR